MKERELDPNTRAELLITRERYRTDMYLMRAGLWVRYIVCGLGTGFALYLVLSLAGAL